MAAHGGAPRAHDPDAVPQRGRDDRDVHQKATGYLRRGHRGRSAHCGQRITDGSQEIAQRRRRPRRRRARARLRRGAARQESTRRAGATSSWATPTTATISSSSTRFVESLRGGNELVMGNRFKGGIKPGAMPPLHRYLGNPVLSFIGRAVFRSPVGDFHCGLRGFDREAIRALGLSPRHGVRERDGRQGDARGVKHRRSADDAVAGRPLATTAPAELARWLASPAVPPDVQSALAVPVSGARHAAARASPRRRSILRGPVVIQGRGLRHPHDALRRRCLGARLAARRVRTIGARNRLREGRAPTTRTFRRVLWQIFTLERGIVAGVSSGCRDWRSRCTRSGSVVRRAPCRSRSNRNDALRDSFGDADDRGRRDPVRVVRAVVHRAVRRFKRTPRGSYEFVHDRDARARWRAR